MFFQKKRRGSDGSNERLAVMAQPLAGHSDQEIVDLLTAQGATDVTILVPGLISAETCRSALNTLQAIARVEPKVKKQLHQSR